jgi:hypothetical protein
MTRTDLLPAFAPSLKFRCWTLDLLDPVAPSKPDARDDERRAKRLEKARAAFEREDRRVEMVRRAGR